MIDTALRKQLEPLVGQDIVIKVGGAAADEDRYLDDVVALHRAGVRPILVHGGGNEVSLWLRRIGKEPAFVDGLRVTDDVTLELAVMVLSGKVNRYLADELTRRGAPSVGLCGLDGHQVEGGPENPRLGHVGVVHRIDPHLIRTVQAGGFLPVLAPIIAGPSGALNINADTLAAELACALGARKFIVLTDVEGVLDRERNLISELKAAEARALIEARVVTRGMIPKVQACLRALEAVPRAHIIDGRVGGALLQELTTDQGIGTMLLH
jgi:acetylglutamate kinase